MSPSVDSSEGETSADKRYGGICKPRDTLRGTLEDFDFAGYFTYFRSTASAQKDAYDVEKTAMFKPKDNDATYVFLTP